MKLKGKITAVVLGVAMAVSVLAGCGSGTADDTKQTGQAQQKENGGHKHATPHAAGQGQRSDEGEQGRQDAYDGVQGMLDMELVGHFFKTPAFLSSVEILTPRKAPRALTATAASTHTTAAIRRPWPKNWSNISPAKQT